MSEDLERRAVADPLNGVTVPGSKVSRFARGPHVDGVTRTVSMNVAEA